MYVGPSIKGTATDFHSPHSVYRAHRAGSTPAEPFSNDVFDKALTERPTILFFHGNVSTSSLPNLSSEL